MAGFRAIFYGYNSSSTQSVWVTDGTEAGTFPITAEQSNAGLLPGVALAMPLGKYVLFPSAGAGNDSGLFISDGTVAGTHQIQVPDASPAGLSPAYITTIGDTAYFQGNSTNAAAAVFSTKGTTATTHVVVDAILAPTSFAGLNGALYFNGLIAHTNTMALYRLDPGNTATQLALTGFTRPDGLVGFGTKLLFRADDGAGQGLFCYDSVLGTASELKTAGGVKPTGVGNLTVFNGKVYFTAGSKLWRTDGTDAGTEQVAMPGVLVLYDTPVTNSPLPILSNRLLLSVIDTKNKIQLVVTDGTSAGTVEIAASGTGAQGIGATGIAAAGDTAVFTGTDSTNHHELWRVDGATLTATELHPAGEGNAFGFFGFFPSAEVAFGVACFLAGTRIMTDRGPVAVERMSAGAQVLTASGAVRPVRWIGHRRIDCTRHPAPQSVWPVRIQAGAFGPRLPSRDLLLSPDHAVFDGGVLIPARYLVNGASVRQEPRDCVTYYHVELDSHDVILAEHLPCESFLDTGNRADFDNAGAVVRLHPDFARHAWHTSACAPLALSGPAVIAARQRLLARAASLGHTLTGEPALHAIADGERLRTSLTGRTLRMRAPATRTGLRLLSRSAIPAETHCDGTDHRRLGVAVCAMRYAGRNLPLDSQRLGAGWHALEHGPDGGSWRWTNGDAAIGLPGGASLEVDVLLTERYWLLPAPLRRTTSRRTS